MATLGCSFLFTTLFTQQSRQMRGLDPAVRLAKYPATTARRCTPRASNVLSRPQTPPIAFPGIAMPCPCNAIVRLRLLTLLRQ